MIELILIIGGMVLLPVGIVVLLDQITNDEPWL
jgi:hypothetical protein